MKLNFVQNLDFSASKNGNYLEAVLQIVKYLKTNEVVTPQGKYWKASPEPGNEYKGDLMITPKGLYAGSAGIGQFFLQLYDVTQDEVYLQEAKDAAEYILNTYEGKQFFDNVLNVE